MRESFQKGKLPNVQGLSFGDGTYDRMKGLAMSKGMNAMDAIRELDDLVAGARLHSSIVLRISCQCPGQAEAGDLRAVLYAGDKGHKTGVNSLEIKEQEDSASDDGVAVGKAELRQMETAGLFQGYRLAQCLACDVNQHSHQVERFLRLTLLDKPGIAGELFKEVRECQLIVRNVLKFFLEHTKVVRKILGGSVHSLFIALSSAAQSWFIVASVSSPMFEMRNVVPLIFP